jgi:hypothetical protein
MNRRTALKSLGAAMAAVVLGPIKWIHPMAYATEIRFNNPTAAQTADLKEAMARKYGCDFPDLVMNVPYPWHETVNSIAYRPEIAGVKVDPDWSTAVMGENGMMKYKTAKVTIQYKGSEWYRHAKT